MKRIRKVLAIFVALAMLLTLTSIINVSAADDTASSIPTVKGIHPEEGIEVWAYQIIKYNEEKTCYEPFLTDNDYNLTTDTSGNLRPTADEINKLAAHCDSLSLTKKQFLKSTTNDDYYHPFTTDNYLAPGTWMIIVKNSSQYLYNPSVLSILKTPDGTEIGELNLADGVLWDSTTYIKVSEPTITKTVKTSNSTYVQDKDYVQFEITTQIPWYTDYFLKNSTSFTYTITDTLTGFTLVNPTGTTNSDKKPSATITGSTTSNPSISDLFNSAITDNNTNFTFDLSNYITTNKDSRNQTVTLQYWAKATDATPATVYKRTNTACLTYSTNQDESTKTADTTHYTFGIDTTLNGSNIPTAEFLKANENTKNSVTYNTTTGAVTATSPDKVLSGATFDIHVDSEDGDVFKTVTTDNNGRLPITGLDSDKVYYIVEKTPPEGYTKNEEAVKLSIVPTPNDGITPLTGYSIYIGNENNTVTSYTYDDTTGNTTITSTPYNTYIFKNTELGELPSTGGIGTTLFTIGGCILMILAAALFFINRRKDMK